MKKQKLVSGALKTAYETLSLIDIGERVSKDELREAIEVVLSARSVVDGE